MRLRIHHVISVLFCSLALPSLADGRDPTIGLCTRPDDFNKVVETIDPLIQELTAAADADKAALGARIAEAHGHGIDIEALIRYREPDMVHVFLPLLNAENWAVRARALYGLKMVGGPDQVEAAGALLADQAPQVREMAVNTLCHIATKVPQCLRDREGVETDRFVQSSIDAAVAVLESGGETL